MRAGWVSLCLLVACVFYNYMLYLHYNGRIFDNREDDPLTVTLGRDEIFPALEEKILGMQVGEVRNIRLAAADAYGPRKPENILRVERSLFPPDRELRAGQKLELELGGRESRMMMIIEHDDEKVVLDGNHPLAGCDLTFALRLDAIEHNI